MVTAITALWASSDLPGLLLQPFVSRACFAEKLFFLRDVSCCASPTSLISLLQPAATVAVHLYQLVAFRLGEEKVLRKPMDPMS